MTGNVVAAIVIAGLIGFLVAFGLTRFSVFLTGRLFLDNLQLIFRLTFTERENAMLADMVQKLTGEKVETVKQMRKKHREMMKKEKSKFERK